MQKINLFCYKKSCRHPFLELVVAERGLVIAQVDPHTGEEHIEEEQHFCFSLKKIKPHK